MLAVCVLAIDAEALADSDAAAIEGIEYTYLVREHPRPLRVHILTIDLEQPELTLHAEVGEPLAPDADDPDAQADPRTAVLVDPRTHVERGRLVAAINANPWTMLDRNAGPRYVEGAACRISGWVVVDGQTRSKPHPNHWSFWIDADGQPHIDSLHEPQADVRLAVAGFRGLIRDGELLPEPGDAIHPRTAVGLDRDKRTLTLVVVEGRYPGYSEGMTYHELARLMRALDCHDAMALDGGGSSVMFRPDTNGDVRMQNIPANPGGPRPLPVMLGVRHEPPPR